MAAGMLIALCTPLSMVRALVHCNCAGSMGAIDNDIFTIKFAAGTAGVDDKKAKKAAPKMK